MKRLIAGGALGVAVSLLASAPALAAPPESAGGVFETQACGFPVQVEVTGKSKFIEHGDRLLTLGPAQKATLTNIGTGETISMNLAGAFHEEVLANGDLVGKATGHNVFSNTSGQEGLVYTTGRVTYTQDAESGVVTITSPSAKIVNLCELLP
jgi:hypothetical protein